ncbi:MAG: S41 family peptidase [Telluria sp.]
MNIPCILLLGPVLLALLALDCRAADTTRLDDATRKKVLAELSSKIAGSYVFPDKAKLVVERLDAREKSRAYRGAQDISQLAALLTADLRQPTRDLHLEVAYSAQPLPDMDEDAAPSAELDRMIRKTLEAENFGIRKVEALAANIGYIDLRSFDTLAFSRPSIAAAMALIAHTDALIIDLRRNNGGDPHTVAFMSSYLFDKPTHLNNMYWRQDKRTDEFWTSKDVPGKKFGGSKKVYVLTSKDTFSAAEEFSYNLKQLRRATIIGEPTGGGAHPGRVHRIHPHLSVFIPNGRAINPVSKTNWEGTGVAPDVRVKAADALRTAERLALQDLLRAAADPVHAQRLRNRLHGLDH